jgi:hypothetical protein
MNLVELVQSLKCLQRYALKTFALAGSGSRMSTRDGRCYSEALDHIWARFKGNRSCVLEERTVCKFYLVNFLSGCPLHADHTKLAGIAFKYTTFDENLVSKCL